MEALVSLDELVLEMVATAAGVDRSTIYPRTSMLDLGLDSISMVSIISRCGAIYRVEIETKHILDLYLAKDFGDFVAAITEMIHESSAGIRGT